jgi:hypothetical protein
MHRNKEMLIDLHINVALFRRFFLPELFEYIEHLEDQEKISFFVFFRILIHLRSVLQT